MTTNLFGEVEIVKGNCPQGIVLRETEHGVVLEEYMDESGQNVDVLHRFDGYTLKDEEDLDECIAEARQYEKDGNVPIYIKYMTEKNGSDEQAKEERKAYLSKAVAQRMKAPWAF